jgi:hypothetical protein
MSGLEVVGVAVGVLGLISGVKGCIDLFSCFVAAKSLTRDYQIMCTKVEIEKTRLLQWVRRTRLLQEDYDPSLNDTATCELIAQILQNIQHLLSDSSDLQQRYGLKAATANEYQSLIQTGFGAHREADYRANMNELVEKFKKLNTMKPEKSTLALKSRWVICDKAKFDSLLGELSYFVTALDQILPGSEELARVIIDEDVTRLSGTKNICLLKDAAGDRDEGIKNAADNHHLRDCERRVLRCLWFRLMTDREVSLKRPNPRTFEWVLDTENTDAKWDSVPCWLSSGAGVYWILGKGKPKLLSTVYANIFSWER